MKNRKLKITMLALLGFLAAEGAVQAQAADITAVNRTFAVYHPYFRSNCWDTSIINGKPSEWLFFGGILGNDQFTLDGEAPPTGHGMKERVTKLEFDATVPVYTITVGNVPEIVDVTPADSDGDDDAD